MSFSAAWIEQEVTLSNLVIVHQQGQDYSRCKCPLLENIGVLVAAYSS